MFVPGNPFQPSLMFVPGNPFQPSLMFVGKARAFPSEAPYRCYTLG